MTKLIYALVLLTCMASCKHPADNYIEEVPSKNTYNEVLVLGAIHSGHLTDSVYHTAYLEKLIREIQPDYILAEIPPNRFEAAMEGFKEMIVFQNLGSCVSQNM